jgi:hypothetical protein
MTLLDSNLQQVKSNKEDSASLASYASKVTPKMFAALKTRDDLDSLKETMESFVR